MTALRIPDLQDKAVLITGASTGIGAALARAFAAQGARVGLHYNASQAAAEALAELHAQYAEGADPLAVLRDLAEITHWAYFEDRFTL